MSNDFFVSPKFKAKKLNTSAKASDVCDIFLSFAYVFYAYDYDHCLAADQTASARHRKPHLPRVALRQNSIRKGINLAYIHLPMQDLILEGTNVIKYYSKKANRKD